MRFLQLAAFLLPTAAFAAAPQILNQTVAVDLYGDVTVSYQVNTDAIVTVDFVYDGQPVPPSCLERISGDINVPVTNGTTCTFRWLASLDYPDAGKDGQKLSASLTAWTPSDPPDYAVVELLTNAACQVRYYVSTNHFPGGLLKNPAYRTVKMPFRRIHATGVTWQMGSLGESGRTSANESPRLVTMDHDYYMALFELTKGQYCALANSIAYGDSSFLGTDWQLRPLERMTLADVRGTNAVPTKTCILNARARGVQDIDVPTEAEWEFAAKAGHYDNTNPDGSPYEGNSTNAQICALACFNTNITFSAGSLRPNSWGLYDMQGNIAEMCLDFYQADASMYFDGAANVSTTQEHKTRDNAVNTPNRVSKGGNYSSDYTGIRPSSHVYWEENAYRTQYGYRLRFYGVLAK